MDSTLKSAVLKLCLDAKLACPALASASGSLRAKALEAIADALEANAGLIASENKKDLEAASAQLEKGELKESLFQRLSFDAAKVKSTAAGIRQLAKMEDPVGKVELARELDSDLILYRVSSPLGVLAVIFESRPEAMPQILALCLKSANAVVLKGGAEAEYSNRILFKIMQEALARSGINPAAFALIETRADVKELLAADGLVDLIIPRGSNELVRYIQNNTKIPVLGHADGICHVYVDKSADLDMAVKVCLDSKTQYPSACNSLETLLIHESVLDQFLPLLLIELQKQNVELRLDEKCFESIERRQDQNEKAGINLSKLKKAEESDWRTEYCELVLAVKSCKSMKEAIEHINQYGSGHTESMIASDKERFEEFFKQVNSAGVYLNASTRFADGYRYGFGAELGISTAKMHPRGPVGIEGLLSYKYKLSGKGQIVADYSGPDARPFTHKDLKP